MQSLKRSKAAKWMKATLIPHSLKLRRRKQRLANFYSQFIGNSDLCFDIGAYKGERTDIFLSLGANVVAVEPDEQNALDLSKKYAQDPRVKILNKGIAEKAGFLKFSICSEHKNVSTFSEEWKTGPFSSRIWDKEALVAMTTLEKMISEFGRPAFCKIDVEGYELKVLKGLEQTIPGLSFEFIKDFLKDTQMCMDRLSSLGYKKYNFCIGDSSTFEFSKWISKEEVMDMLWELRDENFEGGDILWGDIYALEG